MTVKKLLRFYFSADGLNGAMDNLLLAVGINSYGGVMNGEECAKRMQTIIYDKRALASLYAKLSAVVGGLDGKDVATLKKYARLRVGARRLGEDFFKEVHRAVVKFSRHARIKLKGEEGAYSILNKYYALVPPRPDG